MVASFGWYLAFLEASRFAFCLCIRQNTGPYNLSEVTLFGKGNHLRLTVRFSLCLCSHLLRHDCFGPGDDDDCECCFGVFLPMPVVRSAVGFWLHSTCSFFSSTCPGFLCCWSGRIWSLFPFMTPIARGGGIPLFRAPVFPPGESFGDVCLPTSARAFTRSLSLEKKPSIHLHPSLFLLACPAIEKNLREHFPHPVLFLFSQHFQYRWCPFPQRWVFSIPPVCFAFRHKSPLSWKT